MSETTDDGTDRKDWRLAVAALHYDPKHGELTGLLFPKTRAKLYAMADGFGRLSAARLRTMEYDWSHVRDSTPGAIAAIAAEVRRLLPTQAAALDARPL